MVLIDKSISSSLRIINFFIANKNRVFNVSEVMKGTGVCWATACDYILILERFGFIVRKKTMSKKGFVLADRFNSIL